MSANFAIKNVKEWDSRTEVSHKIRDAIVLGRFVVYGITFEGMSEISIGSIESYLIKSYENTNGEKPAFNIKS